MTELKLSDETISSKFKDLNIAMTQIVSSLCDDSDQNEKSILYNFKSFKRQSKNRRNDEHIQFNQR